MTTTTPTIETRTEARRGCGFRKPGGLYLVTDVKPMLACGKLPIPLSTCPTCNQGVKPARGWTWFDARPFLPKGECRPMGGCQRTGCPLVDAATYVGERAGLLWIGERFYPTPDKWMREALAMGVSRRIPRFPKGFRLGTWVFVAHRKPEPAVVYIFRPDRIEYVVKGDETEAELARLAAKGLTLVKVERE